MPRRSHVCVARLDAVLVLVFLVAAACLPGAPRGDFSTFVVAADMGNFTGATEFRGTAEAIARAGAGEFMISPGDIDPVRCGLRRHPAFGGRSVSVVAHSGQL